MRFSLLVILFLTTTTFAQQVKSLKDEERSALLVGLSYKAGFSGGNFVDRWGFNNTLALDGGYKFENNLMLSLNGGFIFGDRFKQHSIFSNLLNENGTITATSGSPADVKFLLRGFTGHISVGYVFNQFGINKNSGVWLDLGVGYMGHKIRVESLFDDVPQLQGDYSTGYDKLTMGVSSRQFVGYLFQAQRRLFRAYAGVELLQGFTRNVREYNFDTGGAENEQRFDFTYGLKVGWIIPIKKRTTDGYYTD